MSELETMKTDKSRGFVDAFSPITVLIKVLFQRIQHIIWSLVSTGREKNEFTEFRKTK